jgi:hypothetical protein
MSTAVHSSLESKVRTMQEALASLSTQLADAAGFPERDLLVIIRRPEWTTPAEQALVEAMVTTITEHAHALKQTHHALIEGALAVRQTG